MRSAIVLVLSALGAAACGGAESAGAGEDDLAASIALQPLDASFALPQGLTAVRTTRDWQALAGKTATAPTDFRKQMAVLFGAGAQPEGTRASIDGASFDKGALTVSTSLQVPGSGCAARAAAVSQTGALLNRPEPLTQVLEKRTTTKVKCVCASALQTKLGAAAKGLLYSSESDYAYTPVSFAGTVVDAPSLLAALGLPSGTPVTVRPLEDELRYQASNKALLDVLHLQLAGAQVYRVGTIQVQLYLIGRTGCGEVAGYHTVAIET